MTTNKKALATAFSKLKGTPKTDEVVQKEQPSSPKTTNKQALSAAFSAGGISASATNSDTKKKIATTSSQESFIEVFFDQIAVAPQVRRKLNRENVENLKVSIKNEGLKQKCEIRHFFDEEEKKELQKKFPKAKYVLVVGHHRMEAMRELGMKAENFILAAKDRYANATDIIAAQFSENNNRAEMTVFDIANGVHNTYVQNPTWTYDQIGLKLQMQKGLISKYLNIHLKIDDEAQDILESWEVSAINTVYAISTLIQEGLDWVQIIKSYAVDESNEFSPSKITEKLLAKIKSDLKKPKEEPKEEPAPVVEPVVEPVHVVNVGTDSIQEEDSSDPAPPTQSPLAAFSNDDFEKPDSGKTQTEPTTSTTTTTEPSTSQPTASPTHEPVSEPTAATPAATVNQADFLRGVAFVLAQDPDQTLEDIAALLNAKEGNFQLDTISEDIFKSLSNLVKF